MDAAVKMAASTNAELDKAKATVQEKAEKMKTSDPRQKQMAETRKEDKIHEANRQKHEAGALDDRLIPYP